MPFIFVFFILVLLIGATFLFGFLVTTIYKKLTETNYLSVSGIQRSFRRLEKARYKRELRHIEDRIENAIRNQYDSATFFSATPLLDKTLKKVQRGGLSVTRMGQTYHFSGWKVTKFIEADKEEKA